MYYNGTITLEDPNLVTDWDVDDQTHAYVVRDVDAQAPDWEGIGTTYRIAYDHSRYDDVMTDESGPAVDVIRAASDRFADSELVARYLRMWHDVASVDYSESIIRDARVWCVVTRANLDAWGCEDPDGLAGQGLDVIRQWSDGDVYGVIVVNTVTGEESSLWDVYDPTPELDYCHSTAVDIAPIGVAS
jgi:hypothetical protein